MEFDLHLKNWLSNNLYFSLNISRRTLVLRLFLFLKAGFR